MDKMGLIKEAIKEWDEGDLTGYEALMIIGIIANVKPPTKEAKKWAINVINNLDKKRILSRYPFF